MTKATSKRINRFPLASPDEDVAWPLFLYMKCTCVIPHLIVGPAPLIYEDFQQLKALNITAILSLQTEEDGEEGAIENERSAASEAGLGFTNLPVTDFDRLELLSKLPKCVGTVERILAAGETLYLHCTAGVNRSPTVAVAYLHKCLQWPLERALEHVRGCRNCCPDEDVIRRANVRFTPSAATANSP